ncbi:PREDICTED: LOB domain-containing protein 42-like [Nicotiana attenuata]|uniref:Lob domain-containing protein 42 n=1 Tax=Nicotiana attenuata TaxID=49451 RepID=A0A1J6HYJ8_NICAT|nr:PREDICTED: LOB domain-containing protein 42-like [Nicotiana attenuata]OIS97925.1 lob domain-containing protein 42 [Nicotiana attenuata]
MRMSCNGCRVLRKGCSENCSLRPCLQWIRSPDSQANATVFLAKFYGRAGLFNLINSGPDHLRPAIFRSLLYEACGRIINPVHGSVGLMCSGNWTRCQEAVESVLKGSTIMQIPIIDDNNTDQESHQIMPLKGCDIRHISKNNSTDIHQVVKTRNRFKRKAKVETNASEYMINEPGPLKFSITGWDFDHHMEEEDELKRAPSHDSFSVETVEPSLVNRFEPVLPVKLEEDGGDVGLELTLGLMSPA